VLLLVPAHTYRAADFLAAADTLGLDVVIGSDGALPIGPGTVVHVDPTDLPRSVARLIEQAGQLDAVVAVDTPMLPLAAELSARLGTAANSLDAVRASMDKTEQRQRWASGGVPQPDFRTVAGGASASDITDAAHAVGFPCVVKAVSLSASQGVLRVDDEATALRAASEIRTILDADHHGAEPLLVEEYVPGPEISIDALLADGVLTVVAVFDKPEMPDGPTFEETMLVTPSRLPADVIARAEGVVERAARALGLRHGPLHAELRIDQRWGDSRPKMLELAARSIGGLCSRALRFADGPSLEEMVLANALGWPTRPYSVIGSSGVLMLPIERDGILRAVEGQPDAAAVAGITDVSITIPIGQPVHPLPAGNRYLGFIFAHGADAAKVEDSLRDARGRLRIVID
jgi:biotin carboxylase